MTEINLIRQQVKEAREMVGKATPAPWVVHRLGGNLMVEDALSTALEVFLQRCDRPKEDATLIASAPSLITSLCDLVEELIEEREK